MTRLKAQGLKPGVSDYLLPVPAGEFHGLWIELKRTSRSSTSPEQRLFQARMRWLGFEATICPGALQAQAAVEAYLGVDLTPGMVEGATTWPQ